MLNGYVQFHIVALMGKNIPFLHPSVKLSTILKLYFQFNFHIYNHKSYSLLNKIYPQEQIQALQQYLIFSNMT